MTIKNIIEKMRSLPGTQRLVIILFLVSFVWVIASSAYSMIHQALIETTTVGAEYTDVVYSDYGFVRATESLVTPETSGEVKVLAEEGERVPKNQKVFTVTTTDDNGKTHKKHSYAPISGIVSYKIDGYEKKTNMAEISELDFRAIYEKEVNNRDKHSESAEAGVPYAKVIDNLKQVYVYMNYNTKKSKIFEEEGDVFRIRFPELNEETSGTVVKIVDNNDGSKFCKIALGPVSEEFLTHRVVETEIYQTTTAKLDLDKDTLVYQDSEPGVYIVQNGTVVWTKVKVVSQSENRVKCETLAEGTVIITNPKLVEPGDTVKGS